MTRSKEMLDTYRVASRVLTVMFNEDGDCWANSSDPQKIIYAAATTFPRSVLGDFVREIDLLIAERHPESELEQFIDGSGVRMGLGQYSVSAWLAMVRNHVASLIGINPGE